MTVPRFGRFVVVLSVIAFTAFACSDDKGGTAPQPTPRSLSAVGSQDYTYIDISLNNFPAGAMLELRSMYYNTSELTADPQARVMMQSQNVYRVEFMNLSAGVFAADTARILLRAVDSVVDELQGIVVLCDKNGPIILPPECSGNCKPLCGLGDNGCC